MLWWTHKVSVVQVQYAADILEDDKVMSIGGTSQDRDSQLHGPFIDWLTELDN